MVRWKDRQGWEDWLCELLEGMVKGGMKWEGAAEREVQEGSELRRGGPLRMARDSVKDCERSRSWADRNWGEDVFLSKVGEDSVGYE